MKENAMQEEGYLTPGNPAQDLLHFLSVAEAKLDALISDPPTLSGNQKQELLSEVRQTILAAKQQPLVNDAPRQAGKADERQSILDALMDYIPEGITIADAPDVKIRLVSKYGRELTGRRRDAITGIPMQEHPENWQVYYPEGETLVPAEMLPLSRATVSGEIIENEEYLLKRRSGEWIYISCNAGPIRDHMGNITGGVIAWRNITKQKQTERQLLYQAQLLDNTHDAIVAVDLDLKITAWNRAAQEMYGRSKAEALGKPVFEVIPSEFSETQIQEALKQLQEIGKYRGEMVQYTKNGKALHVEWTGVLVRDQEGQPMGYVGVIRNITERKHAEAERERLLQENHQQREFLERLVQAVPVAIAVLQGREHCYVLTNAHQEFLTRGKGDLIGRTVAEVWPEGPEQVLPILDRVYQTGEPFFAQDMPIKIIRDHGPEEAIFNLSYTPLYDNQGQVEGVLALAVETTDQVQARQRLEEELERRKQAENALRESEHRFRALANGTPVIIWVTNAAGEIEFINRAYTEFFGVTLQEVQSAGWQPLFHPDDAVEYADTFMDSLREGRPFLAQARVRRYDGEWRWIVSQGQPRRSDSGEILGMAGSSLDISDRKRDEDALRESEARFRSVLENSMDVAYRRNLKTDRYDYMSPVVMQVLGFSEEEMNATRTDEVMERIHPDDRPTVAVELARANEIGQAKLEYRIKHKDGQYRWLADYFTVSKDPDGQPLYRSGIVRDITQVKHVENELRALNQQLEQRVAERTEEVWELQRRLMDGIEAERTQLAREIHDGPIQDIYALFYRVARIDPSLPTEKINEEFDPIRKELLQVNHTLRALSRELLPPMLSDFGLAKAIREHISNIEEANTGLKIDLDLRDDGKSLEIRARLALFRIYQNSITNVIRHAKAKQVDIRFYPDAEHYFLEIQDDGNGFEVPKNWIDFARKGHMGMVSAQERAQALGGKMEVQSRAGKGTLIRVVVPKS